MKIRDLSGQTIIEGVEESVKEESVKKKKKKKKRKVPEVCRNLSKIRKRLGYTQLEVACALGYARPYISMLETGKQIPNSREVILFAELFKIPITELDRDFEFNLSLSGRILSSRQSKRK